MPFDAQLAIAALDFTGFSYSDHPDLSVLRARYPELGFVFDCLEDLQELSDTVDKQIEEAVEEALRDEVNPLKDDVEALEKTITMLEERNLDLRMAIEEIRELTVDAEITTIIKDVL